MNSDFIESLPDTPEGYAQIWIIGSRDQVIHQMNEFYVKRIDPIEFSSPRSFPLPLPLANT